MLKIAYKKEDAMVTFPGILSPPTEILRRKYVVTIEDIVSGDIERVLHEMEELIEPLASVQTRKQLEAGLNHSAQEYLHLKNKLSSLITSKLDEEQLMPSLLQAYHEFSKLIEQDDTVLSPEEQKLMFGLVDSLSDLLEAFIAGFRSERPGIIDILIECSASIQRVDMCTFALLLVLTGEIKQWNKAAVKLLCHTAHEYMLQVEDILLTYNRELAERLREGSETVSSEEVKRAIRLSG